MSYLPDATVEIRFPYTFVKTACPVTAKTTVAWTEKERLKAKDAPIMSTISDLKEYVSICFFLLWYGNKFGIDGVYTTKGEEAICVL
jgi:hypothetical protein